MMWKSKRVNVGVDYNGWKTGFALFPVRTWDDWVIWLERFKYKEVGRGRFIRKRMWGDDPPPPVRPLGPPPPKR